MTPSPFGAKPVSPPAGPSLDLQTHLAALEAQGLLVRVDRPINKDTELHPLVRCQYLGGVAEDKRRAFCSPTSSTARAGVYDIPVVVGAYAASPRIYAVGMSRKVEDIGADWLNAIRNPITPVVVATPPCQEVVITGEDLRTPGGGLASLPVPDLHPRVRRRALPSATLCVTADPDSGIRNIGTYRAALKATDRLGVRMSSRIGGAGGYLHWCKYRDRGQKMPCAIVVGAAPVIAYTGAEKLAVDQDEMAVAGGLGASRSVRPRP